jgi:hypothetical protein
VMLDSLVVLRSSTWLVDTPSLPHGGAEAEDRHSNFYDTWVNLVSGSGATQTRTEDLSIIRAGEGVLVCRAQSQQLAKWLVN